MFAHILVPTDFSACADEALDTAVRVAEKFDAKLTLVHVFEPPTYAYTEMMAAVDLVTPLQDAARELLESAFAALKARYANSHCLLLSGSAATEIVAAVEKQHAELVVIGTRGRTGLKHALLGSVAERVVRLSPVPVLTVRHARRSGTKET